MPDSGTVVGAARARGAWHAGSKGIMKNENDANDPTAAMKSGPPSAVTRRRFLEAGILGGLGMALGWPVFARKALGAEAGAKGFCVVLCNHWSYTGIGWQLGLESDVLSVVDAMEIVDQAPHVKTCINLDARAYELMAQRFPEVAGRLRGYLAAGKLELIGGTYGQPMGTTVSGESNIRQLVMGREAIRQALGYEMVTFLEEEEFTHPQVPQIAVGAGYRYASLAQLDTWGRTGIPILDYNVISWKGVDGTAIPSVPRHALASPSVDTRDLTESAAFKKLAALGTPLVFGWEEFGWEDPEHPAYKYPADWGTLSKLRALADKHSIQFVTLKEYLDQYGGNPQQTVYLPMEAFGKWLTWGLGGDQVRLLARKVEGLLLAAELFDGVACALGAASQAGALERAWKDLLASQSHDVGLCEYSRWQGDRMAPLERMEDKHNFTWGALGYNLLDSAQQQGQAVLDAGLKALAGRIQSRAGQQGPQAAIVFNPHDAARTDLVLTGKLYPLPAGTQGIVVTDRSGRAVPSQVVQAEVDAQGRLIAAEMAFAAAGVPAAGYDTYYLEPAPRIAPAVKTALAIDESHLRMENEFLRVELDAVTGAVASLIHKASGRETIDGQRSPFPRFTGKPNPNLSLHPAPPANYDSAAAAARPGSALAQLGMRAAPATEPAPPKPDLDWVAKGPLLATVRARHHWKYLSFETRVTLAAGRPYVEVLSRVLARVPPLFTGTGPLDLDSGYWLSFTPAFAVAEVVRDYPLAVETTAKPAFHALTFADLLGEDFGLLLLHPGTQWFARNAQGVVGNLLMREWESNFTQEYGWPLYAEYRHALMPHPLGSLANAARLRAAAGFVQPLLCRIQAPRDGDLPPSKSFLKLEPDTLLLSAFRKTDHGWELRVLENEGKAVDAAAEVALPVSSAVETDLLGRKLRDVARQQNRLAFPIEPWKVRTFQLAL